MTTLNERGTTRYGMRGALAGAMALGLVACGGSEPAPDAVQDTAASADAPAAAPAEPAQIAATAEMVSEAYRCRGLMSAAWAAVQVLPEGERPEALADLSQADASVWNARIGALDTSAIPEEEVNAALVQGTRVLATRDALERELPAIAACREAAAAF